MSARRTRGFPSELVPLVLVGPVGAGAMLAAKDHENIWLSAILSLVAIAVVMLWYRYGDDRYDLDRAGDCAYYLGLCFTLGSLIYTLAFHFGAEGRSGEAAAVIPAFGVALSSTLGGVVARIYLQACAAQQETADELSTEPLTPERMRNLYGDQLALAAQAIARELRTTTMTFAQLNRAAFQQADQMARRGAEAGERAARRIDAAFAETEREASRLAAAVKRLNSAVSMNAGRFDESSRSVQQSIREATQELEACASNLGQRLGQFEHALTTLTAALERRSGQADRMAQREAEAGERAGRAIDAAFDETEREASRLAAAVQRLNGVVSMNVRTLEESSHGVEQGVREAVQALEACTSNLGQRLGQFEDVLTTLTATLERRGEHERQEPESTAQDADRPEAVRRETLRLPGRRDGRSAGE